jgi:hypothetical protein
MVERRRRICGGRRNDAPAAKNCSTRRFLIHALAFGYGREFFVGGFFLV